MKELSYLVYKHSPVWLQNFGVSLFGLVWRQRRYGGAFQAAVEEYSARESFNESDWIEYQTARLREVLLHSFRTVPYYRRSWTALGISDDELRNIVPSQIGKLLPTLEKKDVRSRVMDFVSETVNKNSLHTYSTSGTTGTPLSIKFSSTTHQVWYAAYEARCRKWAGVNRKMSRGMLGARAVVPSGQLGPPFWRHNLVERQVYFSAFHLSPSNVPQYVRALNKFRLDYLVGFASSYYSLAKMILDQELEVYRPKTIMTSAEKLTENMRATIEDAFGCEVFDAYSGVEACCLASECEHHRLHLSPDVGVVELLDETGEPVEVGQTGEIVATGLLNIAQPLVRYRTGDMATRVAEACPCGRQMPVLSEVVGRLEDVVIGPDGRETVRFDSVFKGLSSVIEGQVVQESIMELRLRLIITPQFSQEDRELIRERVVRTIGAVGVTFEFVDEIERTEGGKFRAVISKVPRQ
jgi:phenylacetate-CoA ligase